MKFLLTTMLFTFSLNSFASLRTITCQADNKTVDIEVGVLGEEIIPDQSVTFKDRWSGDDVTVSFSILYNGVNDNLSSDTIGRHTLAISAVKTDKSDPRVELRSTIISPSVQFPYSTTLYLFRSSKNELSTNDVKSDMIGFSVYCF